jgi:hypothetical protein
VLVIPLAADPVATVAGSIADKQYITHERNLDNSSTLLHLWTLSTTGASLTSTLDIGDFTIYKCKENDSGTIGIYGAGVDGYQILHPWLSGSTLHVHAITLPTGPDGWWVAMDGSEFVTLRMNAGNVLIEGFPVDGIGTEWGVYPYYFGKEPSTYTNTQGYILGVPGSGKFIWVDTRPAWRTVNSTASSVPSQSTPGNDAYGSPIWDVQFFYSFAGLIGTTGWGPNLDYVEVVLDKYFGYGGTFGFLQFANPPSYTPPNPTGGTLVWKASLPGGGDQTIDANLSIGTSIQTFTPYGAFYPLYQAKTSGINFYYGLDYSSVPDDGIFSITLHTTPPYTGGVANGGWGGFVNNPYTYYPPYDSYYYAQDFYGSMPLGMSVSNPHAKEIQLWDAYQDRPHMGTNSGAIIDFLPLEGFGTDQYGYPTNWRLPNNPIDDGYYLLGAADSFYAHDWSRLTYAGDTLTWHATAMTVDLRASYGSVLHYGVWKGQVAIISHDQQMGTGG